MAAERLVNPRVRESVGELRLVPPEDRVAGPGANWVMAPFTHRHPGGSRFSGGSDGVYYAGDGLATAIAETAFHFATFATDSGDGPRRETMRVLVGPVDHAFHDLAQLHPAERVPLMDPRSYTRSQPFAAELRAAGSDGLHYPSVRRPAGFCLAVFRPTAVGIPQQTQHLEYEWDGTAVRRYFDYADDRWHDLAPAAVLDSAS